MHKLLLTSAGFENPGIGDEFVKLIDNKVAVTKVLFIPTASRTQEELYYVEKSKQELLSLGIKRENILIYNLDHELTEDAVDEIGAIYICGGNPFYLLHKVRKSEFDNVLAQLIDKGIVYVGVSAGSMLMGPDINIPEHTERNDTGITDFRGLNYTENVIIPHYTEDLKKTVEESQQKTQYILRPLTDNQALLITGSCVQVIE